MAYEAETSVARSRANSRGIREDRQACPVAEIPGYAASGPRQIAAPHSGQRVTDARRSYPHLGHSPLSTHFFIRMRQMTHAVGVTANKADTNPSGA
jgi:hypothetical protein